jgi:hypothetical protein
VKDTTPPSCALTGVGYNAQGQKYVQVTTRDTGSGLKRIAVVTATNDVVSVPAFVVGTTAPVVVIATKQDQTQSATVALQIFDVAGNATSCDPLVVDLQIGPDGLPVTQTYPSVAAAEHYLVLANDAPGIARLTVNVDGTPTVLDGLQDNQQANMDLAPVMPQDGTSTLQFTADGQAGASAMILIGDMPLAGAPAATTQTGPTSPVLDLPPSVLAGLPAGIGLDVNYESDPVLSSDAQLGDPSLGHLHPVGKPIRLHVWSTDALTGADVPIDASMSSLLVPLRLPVIGPPLQADGEFAWLEEVRQNGQFVGYRRLNTMFDGSTNTLQAQVSLGELDDTLLLPAVLAPAFVHAIDPDTRLMSSPFADGVDFGPLDHTDGLLQVENPNVAGYIYVFDPRSQSYGWIAADALAPQELMLTP